jgi:hypothetical protein
MSLACRYTTRSRGITFLAALSLAVFLMGSAEASADAVAETGTFAADSSADVFAQDDIHAYDRYLPGQLESTLQANDCLFCWRKTDNRDPVRLALLIPGEAKAPGDPGDPGNNGAWSTDTFSWETKVGKSYLIPAIEIPLAVIGLNVFDRLAFPDKIKEGRKAYSTNLSTTWEQLREQDWHFDNDSFEVNQVGHPYEGATMYGLARSSGLNFWQSLAYAHAGSFLWEMAGETSRPSTNDIITTGNAGSFLGEALFRMAGLVLEAGGDNPPGRNELAAAVLSPPTALNRFVFGDRFKAVFPSHKPATLWQLKAGGEYDLHSTDSDREDSSKDANLIANFSMAYGLPGKPGYTYRRPLDYFDFQFALRSRIKNPLESITLRGLLVGTDYQSGSDYRGIWGLYGSYDYIYPNRFRVSSTALSLGSTAQYWVAPGIALQGTVLGGVGFGTAGTDTEITDVTGFHYDAIPQALLAVSMLFGDRTMIDFTGRGYYSDGSRIDQLLLRGDAGLTVRLWGNHGVSVRYAESLRDIKGNDPLRNVREGTVSVVYTFLSDTHFGAVTWGDAGNRL